MTHVQPPPACMFYSVQQAARILGVSAPTVYRSIEAGELRAVRIRGRLIIPKAVIAALLEPPAN